MTSFHSINLVGAAAAMWLNRGLAAVLRPIARIAVRRRWLHIQQQLSAAAALQSADLRLEHLVAALIQAEDRRFLRHSGFDAFGIARAVWRLATGGAIEGASTITQQLIRTVSRDYELSLRRKIREILLAVLADASFSKDTQARLYLECAYFGWRMNGLREAITKLDYQHPLDATQASQIAARLKYPEPKESSPGRLKQIQARASRIERALREEHYGVESLRFNRSRKINPCGTTGC